MYFLIFLTCSLLQQGLTDSFSDESKLQFALLTGYNVNVRPSDQVNVKCHLHIQNILYLDIVEQTLAVTGSLAVIWHDSRLSWNMTEWGNVSRVYFKPDIIWRPTLVLQNSALGIEVMGDNSNQKSIPLVAHPEGYVFWTAPAYFVSYCSVDVTKFPFDTQTCELKISGWQYAVDSLRLISNRDYIYLNLFEENGEYDITRSYTRVDQTPQRSSFLDTIVFGLELRRKYSYYLVNIVLPVLIMQLLALVVFVIPTESGEKLTFELTLLLSLTVMMTLVAEKIPTTSLQIPTLSIYMLGGTCISALEVIMTVVILYVKHYLNKDIHIGKNTQAFLCTVGALTCRRRNRVESEQVKSEEIPVQQIVVNAIEKRSSEDHPRNGKEEITNSEKDAYDDSDTDLSSTLAYTSNEIASMLDKMSLILFTTLTLVFTLAMLLKVL